MSRHWLFIAFLLTIFLSGCSGEVKEPSAVPTISTPEMFTFRFFVNGTGESLDGEVYLNGMFLGRTENGVFSTPMSGLSPGTVILKGDYRGKPFEFEFELSESDLKEYSGLKYYVLQEDIERLLFDASKLNTTLIEQEVFKFVNLEREKAGLKSYRWNGWVGNTAYNHSKDMAERDYYAHESPEGKDHYDRLKESGMYFIVSGEVLYYIEGLGPDYNETRIARNAVDGWLKSPGHRSVVLDVDNLYSDAGVGAYCKEDKCFITMNVVGLEEHYEFTLDKRYAVSYYLNNPAYGFDFSVSVSVRVEASKPVNVYIFPSKEEYENFMGALQYESIETAHGVTSYEKTITAEVGYVLAVYSPLYDSVRVSVSIRYYPE